MSEYFIMMNHPNGEIMPMEVARNDHDDKVAIFKTLKEAKQAGDDHEFCKAYGYEVFQRGTGS